MEEEAAAEVVLALEEAVEAVLVLEVVVEATALEAEEDLDLGVVVDLEVDLEEAVGSASPVVLATEEVAAAV